MVPAKSAAMLALGVAMATGTAIPVHAQVASLTTSNVNHAGQFDVPLNKSQVLTVDRPFSKAMVGNQEIADILPMTNRSLYVLGKKVGTTSLTLYDSRNMLIAVVDVAVGPDVVTLKRQLSELIPGEQIGARISNDAVVLTGTVSSASAVDRAVQIAKTYAGGDEKVVNMLSVGASQQVMLEVRFSEVNRQAAKELGINHSFINNSGKFVGGVGENGLAGVPVTGSTSSVGSGSTSGSSLTNTITTTNGAPNTVNQAVTSNSQFSNNSSSSVTARGGNGVLDLLLPATAFSALGLVTNIGGLKISSALDALERKGLVKTLAEPTLVALSGETASFLAGGEFPIPVAQNNNGTGGGNSITVEFKPFGVSLGFTPTVLSDGVINLVVEPEVSSIDPSASVQINGLVIPGLLTRRAKTVVELRDGQSFAIAGLLRNDFQDTIRQVPVLGSLPIIGALFRSSAFQKQQTELVMIVTPRLVKPMRAEDVSLPTDRVGDPNELDLFLMGRTDKAVGINPLNPDAMPPERRQAAPAPAAPAADPAGATQSGYEL
ncbi:Flp pilus assembly protein secretin CpaC [Sphingobium herbicidovorans NBRC 16415]|uniref:Flp pilus assembly protein secretin CpaC n=1 Tax=Sphingobium herbicidovorans (strain ATCC 700291 / DSM 11019 / CCUG 56400 / KCTC 2939 / LMG 18315 / NBRC 16415 / MH) TaxID=1219045 RepID=A0A086P8C0_SPHHM|nr:type II and III secretion system protein family protein [Sphingobium herbicidovorans]KFG89638.1 Flp pilus assembly protein secretin CpaC [Sphingobium herbicidovorans NBRC 16415]